jgi:hypothetical protein
MVAQEIEGADFCQHSTFCLIQRNASQQIPQAGEEFFAVLSHHLGGLVTMKALDIVQSQPDGAVLFDLAQDIRANDTNRPELHPVPLAILDQSGRGIKSHRLVVEQRAVKFGRAVNFEPAARVGEQGEADRVTFGEPVERERTQRIHDLFLNLGCHPFDGHIPAQFLHHLPHSLR